MVEDIKCPKCGKKMYPLSGRDEDTKNISRGTELTCIHCNEKFPAPYDIRQALAYKQLSENTYRTSISIDTDNIGVEKVPKINTDNDSIVMDGTEDIVNIDCDERLKRVKAILNAIYNLSDFANQSREMTNATPDVVIISLQKQYNHRLSSALNLNEKGNVDTKHLNSVLEDCIAMKDTNIFAGYLSGVVNNEDELNDVFNSLNDNNNFKFCKNPKITFDEAINAL
jgi:CRISPR-associated protein Cst2